MKAFLSTLWTHMAPIAKGMMFLDGHVASARTLSDFADSETQPASGPERAGTSAEALDADVESLRGTPAYAALELHRVLRGATLAYRA